MRPERPVMLAASHAPQREAAPVDFPMRSVN